MQVGLDIVNSANCRSQLQCQQTKSPNQTVGAAIYIADSDVGTSNLLSGRVAGVVVTGYGISSNKQQPELPNIQFEKTQINTNVNVTFILK